MIVFPQNTVFEWTFVSEKEYSDPFGDVELDVLFIGPGGVEKMVPAFWAGDNIWRVRFSSPNMGEYRFRTICSDVSNKSLQDIEDEFVIIPYQGDNPLLKHGRICASPSKRYLQHTDDTPFFWLADTWWMCLSKRLSWPTGFQTLALDRLEKGFNVIQIVAGWYPDIVPYDERGANEAGFPWESDYRRINPQYFDMADRRICYLVDAGLVPCVVGSWGYHLIFMGIDKIRKHWRYLIARYGAYPVIWCLAGETAMPYYLSETKEEDISLQKEGWTEISRYVRSIDVFNNLITIHPDHVGRDQTHNPGPADIERLHASHSASRNQVEDGTCLDFEMLQTGHSDRKSLPDTVDLVVKSRQLEPRMPVINSEVCYEGIGEGCREEVQRLFFWACVLNGTAGHSYGANGIHQVNTRERPYGPSPDGMSWGDTPWEDAYQLPGSRQLGHAKRLLCRYSWWLFEPHPEWVHPHWTKDDYFAPYAAGIPGKVRIIFRPLAWGSLIVKELEKDVDYHAFLFNPVNGEEMDVGIARPDDAGDWNPGLTRSDEFPMPIYQDWVLVLEAIDDSHR